MPAAAHNLPNDLDTERLVMTGRLVASIVHQINNPMQAIHGALTLALEEIDNPEEIESYLHLSLREAERVINLTNALRQIYRPETKQVEGLSLNQVVRDTLVIIHDELVRHNILVQEIFPDEELAVSGVANQLKIAFLSLLLNLMDAVIAARGADLQVGLSRTGDRMEGASLQFSTTASIFPAHHDMDGGGDVSLPEDAPVLKLSPVALEILRAHQGNVRFIRQPGRFSMLVSLPLTPSA